METDAKRRTYTDLPFAEALDVLLREQQQTPPLKGPNLRKFFDTVEGFDYANLRRMVRGERTLKREAIVAMARALGVRPDHFREYRDVAIGQILSEQRSLINALWDYQINNSGVPADLMSALWPGVSSQKDDTVRYRLRVIEQLLHERLDLVDILYRGLIQDVGEERRLAERAGALPLPIEAVQAEDPDAETRADSSAAEGSSAGARHFRSIDGLGIEEPPEPDASLASKARDGRSKRR